MKYIGVLIILLITVLVTIFSPVSAFAHRSGCHRWHSCPSDSGSYVCGDLGYTSGCGDTTYVAPAPSIDYWGQGSTTGNEHARREKASIITTAKADGASAGKSAAANGRISSPQPDTSRTCTREFTYETPQEPQYEQGYSDGYEQVCEPTYKTEFTNSYQVSYRDALAALKAEEQKKKDTESATWTWVILGGIALWIGISAVVGRK